MRRIADMPPDTSRNRKTGHGLKRTKGTIKPDNTKLSKNLENCYKDQTFRKRLRSFLIKILVFF